MTKRIEFTGNDEELSAAIAGLKKGEILEVGLISLENHAEPRFYGDPTKTIGDYQEELNAWFGNLPESVITNALM